MIVRQTVLQVHSHCIFIQETIRWIFMKQTVSGLEDGTYKLTAHIQGDAAGDENPTVYFYALVDGEEVKADGKLQGYVNWYTVEIPGITPTDGAITVGAHVATAPGGWGTIDDITLVKE